MTTANFRAAAAFVALTAATFAQQPAQPTPRPTAEELLAEAKVAARRGAQAEFLRHGRSLLDLQPGDPVGHLIVAMAHASLGPSFGKDLALQALRRLLAQLEQTPATTRQVLCEFALLRGNDLARLREAIASWRSELERGRALLLAPDQPTLSRVSARAEQELAELGKQIAAEKAKLAHARKQITATERELERARKRKFVAGEGMRDLQPLVDKLTNYRRTVTLTERHLREFDAKSRTLRERARQLSTRLSQLTQ